MDYPKEFPSFAIGIPTLNRWDLLMPTLHLYVADFPHTKIYVVDNGNQPCDVNHSNIEYIICCLEYSMYKDIRKA